MFGYVKPDNPYLYMKDDTLYKAFYCGLCKSLKEEYGQSARFSLTYDMSFMSCFLHNYLGIDIKIDQGHCVTHVIRHTPIAKPDELSKKLAGINVMLAYYKGVDDKNDEKKGLVKRVAFRHGYKKASKQYPEIKNILETGFEKLSNLEKENSSSIDIVSDVFACILQDVSKELLKDKSTEYTQMFFYNLGKWIYLIDAFDDYDKDIKSNNFNVFYNEYKENDFNLLITNHKQEISFIFNSIFMQISSSYSNIKMKFNSDLINNIVNRGLPMTTNKIFNKGIKNG